MFEDVVQALQAWFDHYGHFDVPIDWQVPTHSCLREGVETELGAPSSPEEAVLNDGDVALDKVRDARTLGMSIDDFRDAAPSQQPLDSLMSLGGSTPVLPGGPAVSAADASASTSIAAMLDLANDEPTIEELLALEQEEDSGDAAAGAETGADDDMTDDEVAAATDMLRDFLGPNSALDEDILAEDSEGVATPLDKPSDQADGTSNNIEPPPEYWPWQLAGLRLGIAVHNMRRGDVSAYEDPDRKAKLDEVRATDEAGNLAGNPNNPASSSDHQMGFVGSADATPRYGESYVYGVQWDIFIHLIFMYSKIVGDLCIPFDFVRRMARAPRRNESYVQALSFRRRSLTVFLGRFRCAEWSWGAW